MIGVKWKLFVCFINILIYVATTSETCSTEYLYETYVNNNLCIHRRHVCSEITDEMLIEFYNQHDENVCDDKGRCYTVHITDSQIHHLNSKTFSTNTVCPNSVLYGLILTNSHLQTISKTTFSVNSNWYISEIRELKLDRNDLISVEAPTFTYLRQLQILDLSFNQLTTFGNVSFQLPALKKFYINNNNISEIKGNAFQLLLDLEILNVAHNKIKVLGGEIFNNLHKLEKLYLNHNYITHLQVGTFQYSNNLKHLYLSNNQIQSIEPNTFTNLEMLVLIDLARCNVKTLKNNTFKGLRNLPILNLKNCGIENIQSGAFNSMLALESLDVSYNNLEIINDYTFIGLENVKTLDLTHNKIFKVTSNSFFGLNNLQFLMLTENNIKIVPLGTFQNFPVLENLQLGMNNISEFNVGSFSNLNELKYLNLSYNRFSKINEAVLFPLHSMKLLNLDNNYLSNLNYISLILHLPGLKSISLNNNVWTCSLLTQMLKEFRNEGINYAFNSTAEYTVENVYGIACRDNQVEKLSTTNNSTFTKVKTAKESDWDISNYLRNNTINMFGILKHLENLETIFGNNTHNLIQTKRNLEILNSSMYDVEKPGRSFELNNINNNEGLGAFNPNFILITIMIILFCILMVITCRFSRITLNSFKCSRKRKHEVISQIELAEDEM